MIFWKNDVRYDLAGFSSRHKNIRELEVQPQWHFSKSRSNWTFLSQGVNGHTKLVLQSGFAQQQQRTGDK